MTRMQAGWRWIVIVALISLGGCGGGTSGTGLPDQEVIVQGRITLATGASAAGLTVTLVETGQTTVVSGAGEFSFVVAEPQPQYTLEFQGAALELAVVVADAPAEPGSVTVVVSIDPAQPDAAESTVTFEAAPGEG